MEWKKATDVILIASFVVLAVFAGLGLYQWISRRSLKKVDKRLLWMILPLVLMAATYLICDKVLPKFFDFMPTRPNGSGEPSFPSTHAMVVGTIFFLAAIALPKYIKSKTACVLLDLAMLALLALVCVGRVMSNMHTATDVIAGVCFAAIFAAIYYLITRERKAKNE